MTPLEWVCAGLAAGLLLLGWRLVETLREDKRADRRGAKVKTDLLRRVEKLEVELSRVPKDVPSSEEVEDLQTTLNNFHRALSADIAEVRATSKAALTAGTAEKIVAAHNLLMLDVQALKEWQQSLEQSNTLEDALLQTTQEKS